MSPIWPCRHAWWLASCLATGIFACAEPPTDSTAPDSAESFATQDAVSSLGDTLLNDTEVTPRSEDDAAAAADTSEGQAGGDVSGPESTQDVGATEDSTEWIQDILAVPGDGVGSPQEVDDPPPGPPADDAVIVVVSYPSELTCDVQVNAQVTMRNTGTATWTRADGYKLGAIDDDDPFKQGDPTRVWLTEDDVVPPGGEHTFVIKMKAGADTGVFTTDWQMVHENTGWFGEPTAADITVVCPEETYPLPLPDGWPIVQAVAAAHPDLLANSCQEASGTCEQFGVCNGTWQFLDKVVEELRKTDPRWGYNWKRGVVGDPSLDVVDYHHGPGESENSTDVYIIDVVVEHCGATPSAGWIDQTEDTLNQGEIGRWTLYPHP